MKLRGEYRATDGYNYGYAACIDEDDLTIGLRDVRVWSVHSGCQVALPPLQRIPAPALEKYRSQCEALLHCAIDQVLQSGRSSPEGQGTGGGS